MNAGIVDILFGSCSVPIIMFILFDSVRFHFAVRMCSVQVLFGFTCSGSVRGPHDIYMYVCIYIYIYYIYTYLYKIRVLALGP